MALSVDRHRGPTKCYASTDLSGDVKLIPRLAAEDWLGLNSRPGIEASAGGQLVVIGLKGFSAEDVRSALA